MFLKSTLPKAEEAEAVADARYVAEMNTRQLEQDRQDQAFASAADEELEKRIAAWSFGRVPYLQVGGGASPSHIP